MEAATVLVAVGWVLVGLLALAVATQGLERARHHPLPQLHALLPWLAVPMAPVAVIAALTGRWWLAGAAVLAGSAVLPLLRPLAGHSLVAPPAGAATANVLFANVLADNLDVVPTAAALLELARDVDIVALAEVHQPLADELDTAGLKLTHPFVAGAPGIEAEATMVWSRLSLRHEREVLLGTTRNVTVEVAMPDGRRWQLVAVHTLPPARRETHRHWISTLDGVGQAAQAAGEPVLVVGDLNASRWHPAMRRLLRRTGLVDAHEALGRRWARSWPVSRWAPRFVQLDHALCGPGITPLEVRHVSVPGSDHEGFVVSVAVSAV